MKTLIASDLHSNIDVAMELCKKIKDDQIECLILGGDIISGNHPTLHEEPSSMTLGFLEVIYELLSELNIPIYITPGNHDTYPFDLWKGRDHISVVIDSWINIGKQKIFITPWSLSFNDWAWMHTDDVLHYEIPSNITAIVSHGPMYGYYDLVDNEHMGSKTLLNKVLESNVSRVYTGHIHGTANDPDEMIIEGNRKITVKNISLLDDQYCFKNKFIMEDF